MVHVVVVVVGGLFSIWALDLEMLAENVREQCASHDRAA